MKTRELAAVLKAVKVMEVRPDDVLVFKAPGHISDAVADRIRAELKRLVPDRQIIVLGDGAELEVVRRHEPTLMELQHEYSKLGEKIRRIVCGDPSKTVTIKP